MYSPTRRFAVLLMLVVLFGAGVTAPAAEPTVFPKDARQRFDQADELRKKQQFSDAIKAFDEAIKLGMDKYPRAFLYRADASRGLKNYDSAIAQYSEFIERFGIEESCRYWIREAYRGRAAAYEKKGDYESAVRDQGMVSLLFSVELEVLNEVTAADREKLMVEAAGAYRDRGRCLQACGRSEAATSVFKRAEELDQEARKLTQAKTVGQIELINRWSGGAVTMLIDGETIQLAAGETKLISKPAGSFRYEIPASKQTSTGQVEAGKVFRLQIK